VRTSHRGELHSGRLSPDGRLSDVLHSLAGVLVTVRSHQRSSGEGALGFSFAHMAKTRYRVFKIDEILRVVSICSRVDCQSVEFGHIGASKLG